MEFIRRLKESTDTEKVKHFNIFSEQERPRLFQRVQVGIVGLSIQASVAHYCVPRLTLEPGLYTDMELAVFVNDEWTDIDKHEVFDGFKYKDRFIEAQEATGVYGYLSITMIEELYQFVKFKKVIT